MDCCDNKMTNKKEDNVAKDVPLQEDEKRMQLRIVLWVIIGLFFVVALFLAFKVGAAQTIGATLVANAAPASGGMVGGC